MNFRLRQLQAFKEVARTGSVTHAAHEMGISQPAASRLLSDFSKTVDFALFEKRNGSLVPTAEAEYMLVETARVFESLNQLEDLRHTLKDRTVGHLRIACLPGFATNHLPQVLTAFLKDRPGVTVTLEPDRPERILEWIIGQQYDCAITDGFSGHPATQSTDIAIRTVCVFPQGHELAKKSVVTPSDIGHEKLIHSRRGSPFFRQVERAFFEHDQPINSWIEVRQFTAACIMVSQGEGVSIVSALDAEQFRGRGIEIRPFAPKFVHRLSLLRPSTGSTSPIVTDFLRYFSQSLAPFTA